MFEKEPPGIDYPLVQCDNVTITPHMAGGTKDAFLNSPVLLAREMKNVFCGETSNFLLNANKCIGNELL